MKSLRLKASAVKHSKGSKSSQVKLLVGARRTHFLSSPFWRLGSWLIICGSAILALHTISSGVRLIIDPYSENWLKTVFPKLNPTESAPLQTLEEIKASLREQGLISGRPVLWQANQDTNTLSSPQSADWIFPVQETRNNCQSSCTSITELHIYRPQLSSEQSGQDIHYRLIQQIRLRRPKESFVTTPLIDTASEVASVDQPAALTQLRLFDNPITESPWILLEGTKTFGNTDIRYGQLLYYNPRSATIHTLISWTSPAGQSPVFRTINRQNQPEHLPEQPPELLIDQTVGMEPQWQTFQVRATNPPQVKEISLLNSGFDQPPPSSLYDKALRLARSGVWSHAQQMMQSARTRIGTDWTPEAEAQLRLIDIHAEQTQAQAQRNWSGRQQQLQAYLIDGQWDRALTLLKNNPGYFAALSPQLKRNFERLWKRVQAHLQIHPQDQAAQLWGALLVTARQDANNGKQWLTEQVKAQTQAQTQATFHAFETILNPPPVEITAAPLAPVAPSPSAATIATSAGASAESETPTPIRYRRLLGSAQPIEAPGPNWLTPTASLPRLAPGQRWYRIHLLSLYDNNNWNPASQVTFSGVSNTPESLWQWLGLGINNPLQLVTWTQATQTTVSSLRIVGLQRQGNTLSLLGIGPGLTHSENSPARPPLVMTANSVQWINKSVGTPLSALLQSEGGWPRNLPNQLETALGLTHNPTDPGINPTILALAPFWQTYYLDVTGDSSPELFLSLDLNQVPEALAQEMSIAGTSGPRTLILNSAGKQLYSDLSPTFQNNHMIAVVPGSPALPTALLMHQNGNYSLKYVGQ